VAIKTVEQQALLSVHRVRQGFVKARTAQANQIRGPLTESGLVLPQGIANVFQRVPPMIDGALDLPASMRQLIDRLLEKMKVLDRQVKELEAQIKA
jgi:transposase